METVGIAITTIGGDVIREAVQTPGGEMTGDAAGLGLHAVIEIIDEMMDD